MSNKQIAAKSFKISSELFHSLQLEPCPDNTCFSVHLELWYTHVIKSWIKAIQRYKLNITDFLIYCPVKDCIIMNSQVISEP